MNIKTFFYNKRYNEKSHEGLGDIRLTVAEQNEIVEYIERLHKKNKDMEKIIMDTGEVLHHIKRQIAKII